MTIQQESFVFNIDQSETQSSLRERGSMFEFTRASRDCSTSGDRGAKLRGNGRGRQEASHQRFTDSEISEESMDLQPHNIESSSNSGDDGSKNAINADRAIDVLQTSDQGVCKMAKSKQTLRSLWNRAVREIGVKQRVLHDVWEKPRHLYGVLFCQSIRNIGRYKRDVFIVAEHGKHLHVIHDCAYTNSQFRCAFMQQFAEQEAEIDRQEEPCNVRNNGGRKQRRRAFGLLELQKEAEEDYEKELHHVFRRRESRGSDTSEPRGRGKRSREDRNTEESSSEENLTSKKAITRWGRRRYAAGSYDTDHWINLVLYLSQNGREIYIHYRSEEKRGSMVVKLEIYRFEDCLKKEKKEWW